MTVIESIPRQLKVWMEGIEGVEGKRFTFPDFFFFLFSGIVSRECECCSEHGASRSFLPRGSSAARHNFSG